MEIFPHSIPVRVGRLRSTNGVEQRGMLVSLFKEDSALLGHILQPGYRKSACMIAPLTPELNVKDRYMFFLPDSLQAFSVYIASSLSDGVEQPVAAAGGNAGVED